MLRFPGLLTALILGSLLLSLAATASPLFLAATSSGQVEAEISKGVVTPYGAGVAYITWDQPLDAPAPDGGLLRDRQDEAFTTYMGRSPHLMGPIRSVLGPVVTVTPAEGGSPGIRMGRIFAREGAVQHVEIVAGEEGSGIWLPTNIAPPSVAPGDRVVLQAEGGPSVEVSVDGVYRALYLQPRQGFWRAWGRHIYQGCQECPALPSQFKTSWVIPPQFVLVDLDNAIDLTQSLGGQSASLGWESPVSTTRLTLDQARDLQAFVETFAGDISDRDSELFEVFRCCGRIIGQTSSRTELVSQSSAVVSEVDERMIAIEGPVRLLLSAGLLVAAAVVAGAGAFAMATRRVEASYLFAHGRSPITTGARASLEALIPSILGSAAGLGLALLLTRAFGPGGPIGEPAFRTAILLAALVAPASALLVGAASAVSFLRQSEHHLARLGLLAKVPWELVLIGLSAWLLSRLYARGAFVVVPGKEVERPSGTLLVFPVLFVGGTAVLVARGLRLGLGWLRPRTDQLSAAPYLAANRLAGGPKLAVLLFAASALCLGVFVHAQTIVRTLQTTLDGKAKLFVGSDVQLRVDADYPRPERFPLPVTKVTRIRTAGRFAGTERQFDLLAVDPATLPSSAFWSERFADRSLTEMVRLLRGRSAGELPIIVSGWDAPDRVVLDIAQQRTAAVVVAEAKTFPGTFSRDPLVVIDAAGLEEVYGGSAFRISDSSTELWVKGSERRALEALAELGLPPYSMLATSTVKDIPSFSGVINTFSVLNILALGAGALVLVVTLMYLQARQRAQVVAYALSRRMGLPDAAYLRSLVLELAGMLGASFVVGLALSLVASRLIVPLLDPLSTIPPEPLFTFPSVVVIAAALGLLAVSWLGGWLTNRQARRSNLAEVMQLAE
jgi:hypothetical protein